MDIRHYMNDGMNHQARATLAYLQWLIGHVDGVEISTWVNGRETGYLLTIQGTKPNTLHIAFYEHRRSDSIVAITWRQNVGLNPATIGTASFGGKFQSSHDLDFSVEHGEVVKMAEWIESKIIEERQGMV